MVELDHIARVVERFMYSLCGPATNWMVEFRPMTVFGGDGKVAQYIAVVIDFLQKPNVFIQIKPVLPEYHVIISREETFPEMQEIFPNGAPPAFIHADEKVVPANDDALLAALNGFLSEGILVQNHNTLQYNGPLQPN